MSNGMVIDFHDGVPHADAEFDNWRLEQYFSSINYEDVIPAKALPDLHSFIQIVIDNLVEAGYAEPVDSRNIKFRLAKSDMGKPQ